MAFLKNLFGGNKDFSSVLTNTKRDYFRFYGVSRHTSAQDVTALFYICEYGIALLSQIDQQAGGGLLNVSIARWVKAAADLASPTDLVTIDDLTQDRRQRDRLVTYYKGCGFDVDGSVHIDGLLAFDGLHTAIGPDVISDMLARANGPFGMPGYASLIMQTGVLGEGAQPAGFPGLEMQLFHTLSKDIVEVVRASGGK